MLFIGALGRLKAPTNTDA